MNASATMGHNNPPDPVADAWAPFADQIEIANNTLTGASVENEAQMKAIDDLTKDIKAARKAVEAAEEAVAKPLYDQWKAAKAEFKPTLDDLDRIVKGLVAMVGDFKKKLAAQKAERERIAREEADRARQAAIDAAASADATDIEAQREISATRDLADAAQRDARAAAKDGVKGMRSVTRHEVTDDKALLNWIARNRRDDLTAFIHEWARRNHTTVQSADGLRVWQEKEAF